MRINSFDIDGVIYMGDSFNGVYPGPNDILITGRSFEEEEYTRKMLTSKGIYNKVYFNPLKFDEKTRQSSGEHKKSTIQNLREDGIDIGIHFEDDPIQAAVVSQLGWVNVVLLQHELVEKENVWHETKEDSNPL
jgi:hypothetical protein